MDQTNLVTIIGMIAAFITASVTTFLAEPIKDYYQNRGKLRRLRLALYTELVFNYSVLSDVFPQIKIQDITPKYLKATLRLEGYQNVVENETSLFYQLSDSLQISSLYAQINYLSELLSDKANLPDNKFDDHFIAKCKLFRENFEYSVYGWFDMDTMKQIVTETMYEDLSKRGRLFHKHQKLYRI